MKKMLLSLGFVLFGFASIAQQNHIAISKSLVGFWRFSGTWVPNGSTLIIPTNNYKVINSDGTYYTFSVSNAITQITVWGRVEMTSDSTFTEFITKNGQNPGADNVRCFQTYKIEDGGSMMLSKYKNSDRWSNERWIRVPSVK
ncbi:MAG: DUF4488 domain-containing protein [Bacteroidales bacterium]|nr:DUF4488 domain-containing protein [Bacteroidales bacterium]